MYTARCTLYSLSLEKIKEMNPKGIIFTGGPNSVYLEEILPHCGKEIFELGIPILGICYGSQLMSYVLGGEVKTAPVSEYGKTEVAGGQHDSLLFEGVSPKTICWMSHTDYISQVHRKAFEITAHTAVLPGCSNGKCREEVVCRCSSIRKLCIPQEGTEDAYLTSYISVCGCTGDWKMDSFVENTIQELREKIGDR